MDASPPPVHLAPALLRRQVTRPRLVAQVEAAVTHPLTLVRGGSGCGKTSLLAEWAATRGSGPAAVWVRVDALSAGRLAFWSAALEALTDAGIAPAGSLLANTVPSEGSPDELRRTLARGLAQLDAPVLLVVDDLHLAEGDAVAADLLWLLERSDRLRVLVASRSTTAFETPVAIAHFDPTIITAEHLAFTLDEMRQAATDIDVHIDEDDLATLHARVEGWPLGVRLLLVELENTRDSTDALDPDRAARTVVAQASARLVSSLEETGRLPALLRISIAERLTPELLEHLLGTATADLDWIELEGLGARDTTGRFRLHALVREVLETELERRHPDETRALRRRLAAWANENDDPPTALRQAALIEDWDLLATVTRRHFGPIVRLYPSEMQAALDAVPLRVLRRSPILITVLSLLLNARSTTTAQRLRGLVTVAGGMVRDRLAHDDSPDRMWLLVCRMAIERISGRHDQAARTADEILDYLPTLPREPGDGLDGTLSIVQLHVATSLFYVGRHHDAVPLLREVAAHAAPWRAVHAASLEALIHAMRGDMPATEAALEPLRARQSPTGWRGTYSGTGYHLAEAIVALERFDEETARRELGTLDRHRATIEHWPLLLRADGLAALAAGDAVAGAHELAAAVARRRTSSTSTAMHALVGATRADLLIAAGQTQRARALLDGPLGARRESHLPAARLALAESRTDRALAIVDDLVWEGAELPRSQAEALLVRAVALGRTLGPAAGIGPLDDALRVMERAGLRRPLMMVPRDDLLPLLEAAGVDATLLDGVPDPFGATAVIPALSARELEVLTALVDSSSTAEIGARLFVSTNTVKTQLRSVYRKLGASSREEALRIASERGLVRGGA